MSTTIDTRVVEMKFDNQRFRENIQETIDSLKELDRNLKIEDSSKAFENITEEVKKVNLNPLSNAIDTVKVKFNLLEVAAITALSNIVNKAVNAGERIVKSLTIDNAIEGWRKFEEITNNSAVLVNQGNAIEDVEETLEELKFVADETSYSITNFTDIMGKFAAKPGFTMDRAKRVAEGIALLGATAAQNASVVNRVSMQMAQVSGYVKAMDWSSIRTANLDTVQFKKLLADQAVAEGTLKEINGQYETLEKHIMSLDALFTEGLQDQWLSLDVFADGLSQYSESIKAVQDRVENYGGTASRAIADLMSRLDESGEYIDEFGNRVTEFSLKAFQMGQEARTWTDVVNSLKDAISSQWENIYASVFGNYEEAKQLFTGLINLLNEVFVGGMYERSDVFALWKDMDGRKVLLDGVSAGLLSIKDTLDMIKEIWSDIFNPVSATDEEGIYSERIKNRAEKLLAITEKFRSAMYGVASFLRRNEGNITSFFTGIFELTKSIKEAIVTILDAVLPKGATFSSIMQVVFNLLGAIGTLLSKTAQWIRESKLLDVVIKSIQITLKLIKIGLVQVATVIVNVVSGLVSLVSTLYDLGVFDVLINVIYYGLIAIVSAIDLVISAVKTLQKYAAKAFVYISNLVKSISNFYDEIKDYSLEDKIYATFNAIKDQFNKLGDYIENWIKDIKNKFETKFPKTASFFNALFGGEGNGKSLKERILELRDSLYNLFNTMDYDKVIAIAFAISTIWGVLSTVTTLKRVASGFESLTSIIKDFQKALKRETLATTIYKIASSISILAFSLYLLTTIDDPEKLKKVTASLSTLIFVITGMSIVIGILTKLDVITNSIKKIVIGTTSSINEFSTVILGLATSILAIAAAMKILSGVESFEGLDEKLSYVYNALLWVSLIATVSYLITSLVKGTTVAPFLTILSISLSLGKIVDALGSMATMNTKKIKESVEGLVPIMMAFGVLCMGAGQIRLSSALGLLTLFEIMKYILPELDEITAPIRTEQVAKLITTKEVMDTLLTIAILFAIRGKEIGSAGKGITSLLIVTSGLMILLGYLTKKNFTVSENVITALETIFHYVALIEGLSYFTKGSKMTGFSVGLLVLTGVIEILIKIAQQIQTLKLKPTDFAVFTYLFEAIEGLIFWSASTKFTKPTAIISIFAGLYILFGYIVALSSLSDQESVTNACNNVINVIRSIGTTITAVIGMFTILKKATETKDESTFGEKLANKAVSIIGTIAIISALGHSIKSVAKALSEMDTINADKVGDNALALAIVVGAIAGASWVIVRSMKNGEGDKMNWGAFAGTVVAMVLAFGEMAGAAYILYKMDEIQDAEKTKTNAIILGGLLVVIAGIVLGFNMLVKKDQILSAVSSAGAMVLLSLSLLPLVQSLIAFNDMFTLNEDVIKKLGILAVAILALAGLGFVAGKFKEAAIGMIAVASAIVILASALYIASAAYDRLAEALGKMQNLDSVKPVQVLVDSISSDTEIRKYSGQLYNAYYEIGKHTIIGMYKGMEDEVELRTLEEKAIKLGEIVKIATMRELDENSPSEVFRQLGIWLVQGFSGGIDESVTESETSAENLAKKTISATGTPEILGIGRGCGMMVGESFGGGLLDSIGKFFSDTFREKHPTAALLLDIITGKAQVDTSKFSIDFNKIFTGEGGLSGVLDQVNELATSALPNLTESFDNLLEKLNLTDLVGQFKEVFDFEKIFNIEGITDTFNNLDIGSYLERFINEFAGGESIAEKVASALDGMSSGLSDVTSAATETGSEVTTQFESIQSSIRNATDVFSEFNNEMSKSSEEMVKNLQSQTVGIAQWSNNILRVAAKGIDPILLRELVDKGPSAFAEVAAYAQMSSDQIKEVNRAYEVYKSLSSSEGGYSMPVARALQYAYEVAVRGTSNALDEYSDVLGTAAEGLEVVEEETENTISVFEELSDSLASASNSFDEFNMSTEETANDMLYNMESQIVGMSTWADNIVKLAKKGLNVNLLKELGDLGTSGYSKVAAYAKMTVEEIAEANKAYLKKGAISKAVPEEIVKAYQYAGEMAVNGFSNALDEYSDIIDYDPLTDGLDDVVNAVEETATEVKSIFETLADSIASMDPFSEFTLNTEKSKEDMLEALKTNIFGVAEWSNNLTRLAARGLNTQVLQELVNKGASGSFAEVQALIQMTDEEIKEYNSLWEINNRQASSAALQVTKALQASVEILTDGVSETLAEYTQLVNSDPMYQQMYDSQRAEEKAEAIKAIKEALKDEDTGMEWSLSEERIDKLTDTVIADLEEQQLSITKTKQHIIDEFNVSADAAESAISVISQSLDDFNNTETNIKIGSDVIASIEEGMNKELPAVHTLVQNAGLEDSDFYAKAFNQNMDEFLDTLYPKTIQPKTEETKDRTTLDWENIGRVSADTYEATMTEGISEFLDTLWPETIEPKSDAIKENMLAAWESYARSSVGAYSTYTEEELQELYDTLFPDYMDPALTGIEKSVNEKVASGGRSSGKTYSQSYVNSLLKTIDELKSQIEEKAAEAGSQVANGMSRGIKEGIERVKVVTTEMARTIDQTTREHLLVESPSKVMEMIGSFVTEGLAIGITEGTPEVESSAYTMADMLTSAVDSALDFLNNDSSMQPVLTPVLDLSEIQNGANSLDTIFGTRQVSLATDKFNANVEYKRGAQMDINTSRLEEALGRYSESIAAAVINSDKQVEVNVTLQGDSAKLFSMIRKENSKFTKVNGYNALA